MADQRTRELERRFKETGDPGAWGAWLRARVREGELDRAATRLIERIEAGALTRERVQLAGYLGDALCLALDEHETIALATYLGDAPAVRVALDGYEPTDVSTWLTGLSHWGAEVPVRAVVACALHLRRGPRGGMEEDYDPYDDIDHYAEMTDRVLEGPLRWLGCPCAFHADEAYEAGKRLEYHPRPSIALAWLACQVIRASTADPTGGWAPYPIHVLDEIEPEEAVGVVRRALIPWALGDPVT